MSMVFACLMSKGSEFQAFTAKCEHEGDLDGQRSYKVWPVPSSISDWYYTSIRLLLVLLNQCFSVVINTACHRHFVQSSDRETERQGVGVGGNTGQRER